jgi:SsrA-binding protein
MPDKTVAVNRRARHEYAVEETLEAGIVLTGTEIKSIRAGRVNLAEAYARIERGEAWLIGAHIAPYEQGNRNNHEPTRTRKLLLHRDQISELVGRTQAKGFTLVPLKLYIRDGMAKLELGVGKGKKAYDKRRTIAERDVRREIERSTKERVRM